MRPSSDIMYHEEEDDNDVNDKEADDPFMISRVLQTPLSQTPQDDVNESHNLVENGDDDEESDATFHPDSSSFSSSLQSNMGSMERMCPSSILLTQTTLPAFSACASSSSSSHFSNGHETRSLFPPSSQQPTSSMSVQCTHETPSQHLSSFLPPITLATSSSSSSSSLSSSVDKQLAGQMQLVHASIGKHNFLFFF